MRTYRPINNHQSIPAGELPNFIGKLIHLKWAAPGCVWRLKSIDGDNITIETPKTHRTRQALAVDAQYTKRYQ